jgi:hypothetical protein
VNLVDERALAWALLDSATAFLKPAYRAALCAKIGAGERYKAIRELLASFANTQAEMPFELAAPTRKWIQGYAGSDSEPILRNVYDRIQLSVAKTTNSQWTEAEPRRRPQRLTAKRSEHAARASAKTMIGDSRAVICGVTTSIEALVDAAVEARRAAQAATEVAVREARSVDWSWDRISNALGGSPTANHCAAGIVIDGDRVAVRVEVNMGRIDRDRAEPVVGEFEVGGDGRRTEQRCLDGTLVDEMPWRARDDGVGGHHSADGRRGLQDQDFQTASGQ